MVKWRKKKKLLKHKSSYHCPLASSQHLMLVSYCFIESLLVSHDDKIVVTDKDCSKEDDICKLQ